MWKLRQYYIALLTYSEGELPYMDLERSTHQSTGSRKKGWGGSHTDRCFRIRNHLSQKGKYHYESSQTIGLKQTKHLNYPRSSNVFSSAAFCISLKRVSKASWKVGCCRESRKRKHPGTAFKVVPWARRTKLGGEWGDGWMETHAGAFLISDIAI